MKLMKIKAPPSKKGTKPEINTKKTPNVGAFLCAKLSHGMGVPDGVGAVGRSADPHPPRSAPPPPTSPAAWA